MNPQNPAAYVGWLQSLISVAAGRNYLSALSGILIALGGVGLMDPEHQKIVIDSINQIMDGAGLIAKGFLALVPVVVLVSARFAGVASSIFGRAAAINADAEKDGLRLVVAETSKVAPLAQALPGPALTVAAPETPVKVSVPAPVQPIPTVKFRSTGLVLLLLLLAPTLGGCSAAQAATRALEIFSTVRDSLATGLAVTKEIVRTNCGEVGAALQMANQITDASGASCKARVNVNRYASAVADICNNIDGIKNVAQAYSLVRDARTKARAVIASGC